MDDKEILGRLKKALKEFGNYSFDDKGPHEVMDMEEIVTALNARPVEEVVTTLEKVIAKGGNRGKSLVGSILTDMQGIADDRWNVLMASKTLEGAFG